MKKEHPDDTELQMYVFQREDCKPGLIDHINTCESCRSKAAQYNFLSEGIRIQDKAVFDFDLSSLVMDRLPEPQITPERPTSYALVFVVFLLSSCLVYFFGAGLSKLIAAVKPLSVGLIVTAVLGLFFFLSVDMVRQYRARLKALDF